MVFFSVFTSTSFALSSDEKEPIRLTSKSATCKRKNFETICIYSGNALFNQGTTTLRAQQITIYKKTGQKINKIVASGERSHYSTILENKQQIDANANLITIYTDRNLMVLEKDGAIVVGQDKYSGPYIEYKLK